MANNVKKTTSNDQDNQSLVKKHPLAVASGALLVGVALGSLIPRSESERKAMRNTGEKLRARTKDAVSAAQEAGKVGLEDAGITVEEAKLQVRDLVRRASEAVNGAGNAARKTLIRKDS